MKTNTRYSMLGLALLMAGCGGEFPVAPTPVATSVVAVAGTKYQGTLTLGNGATTSFNMTLIARGLATTKAANSRIRATMSETSVSGSFSTGSGLTGTVQGSLAGTLENGVFQGSLAATSAPQAEERNYSGPVTSTSAAWVPGACVQNCTADGLSGAIQTVQTPTAGNPPACSYVLASGDTSFAAGGGNGNVSVTATPNCAWSAEALVSWITIVGSATAVGSGGVAFTVQANTGAARQGSLRVAGQTVPVSQAAGSSPATAPAITAQPQSQTIASGTSTTLTVTATGTAPLTYQWYLGLSGTTTNPIPGATTNSFTTPTLTGTTNYWVRVSNAGGVANSTTATVTVTMAPTAPTITTQPASQTIASGGTATMTVAATGTAPLTYQWYLGSSGTTTSLIANATSSSYTTPALSSTTNYWVRVTNAAGSANSNTAVITVTAPPKSNLVFTFIPNPVTNPSFTTSCSGGSQPVWSWFYNLRIQNNSTVPFTIQSWTLNSPQGINETYDAARFVQRFGTQTIPANGSVTSNFLCVWFNVATSGSITHSFTGTNGNGPFTTPSVNLLAP